MQLYVTTSTQTDRQTDEQTDGRASIIHNKSTVFSRVFDSTLHGREHCIESGSVDINTFASIKHDDDDDDDDDDDNNNNNNNNNNKA